MTYQQAVHRRFETLAEWLDWIALVHPKEIALGLERVKEVSNRLGLAPAPCPVIIVGGTNGKGSCVATLEKIYCSEGYRVGAFTSPVLFKHNEYVRIQGQAVDDASFCEAYGKIENARGDIALTPFEYHTLAAFEIFRQHSLDAWILEVGLGGRLDAVNVMDADVSIVTSIGIDHVDWLGDTREKIGREKAGIFRENKPAVCGDFNPPDSLTEYAREKAAPLFSQGQNFGYTTSENTWSWWSEKNSYSNLPSSQLAHQNISSALMAIELLQSRLPVTTENIYHSIENVFLPGRIEIQGNEVLHIFDVAHNPAAVAFLANHLKQLPCLGKTYAVFSMLGDKDIAGSIKEIKNEIAEWHIATLPVKRAASKEQMLAAFQEEEVKKMTVHSSIIEAYDEACKAAKEHDRVIIFGSFHTVAEVKFNFKRTLPVLRVPVRDVILA